MASVCGPVQPAHLSYTTQGLSPLDTLSRAGAHSSFYQSLFHDNLTHSNTATSTYCAYVPSSSLTYSPAPNCRHHHLAQWLSFYFIAYALHCMSLHPSVTFSALILLRRLKVCFPPCGSDCRVITCSYSCSCWPVRPSVTILTQTSRGRSLHRGYPS